MGFSGSKKPKLTLEEKLEKQKRELAIQVETNNIKIISLEREIEELDKKIKEGESDIKLNQFQYTESELKSKAKKLVELNRDKNRVQKSLESVLALNQAAKNNLDGVEKKILENQNIKILQNGNEVMNQYNEINKVNIISDNVGNLAKQKAEEEKIQKILNNGNDAYVGEDNLNNEEAYLNELLGKGNKTPF